MIERTQADRSKVPKNLAIWDWLFDPAVSPWSPFNNYPTAEHAAYEDAETKERLDWTQVRDASTYISTALAKEYGYKEGQTLSLFSRNTVWYPVMMFSAIRVGMSATLTHNSGPNTNRYPQQEAKSAALAQPTTSKK